MSKQRYEVVAGTHYDQDLTKIRKEDQLPDPERFTVFTKGDIVESDRELDKVFINKFKKIVDQGPRTVSEKRKSQVDQMISSHSWAENDRGFLEQLPDDGFNRLVQREGGPVDPVHSEPTHKTKKPSSALGDDVTDEFQVAYDEGYKVWRNASGKHQVTKGNAKKPLNVAPLDYENVDPFIVTYMKEK